MILQTDTSLIPGLLPGKQSPAQWHRVQWGAGEGPVSTTGTPPDETSRPGCHDFVGSITCSIQAILGFPAGRNHLAPTQLCFGSTERSPAIRGKIHQLLQERQEHLCALCPLKGAKQPSAQLSTLETDTSFPTDLPGRGMSHPPLYFTSSSLVPFYSTLNPAQCPKPPRL